MNAAALHSAPALCARRQRAHALLRAACALRNAPGRACAPQLRAPLPKKTSLRCYAARREDDGGSADKDKSWRELASQAAELAKCVRC
jgi:hypothetical protein